jgi:hypothetical protein
MNNTEEPTALGYTGIRERPASAIIMESAETTNLPQQERMPQKNPHGIII